MSRHSARFPLAAITALTAGVALVATGCSASGSAEQDDGSQTAAHMSTGSGQQESSGGETHDEEVHGNSAAQQQGRPPSGETQQSPTTGDDKNSSVPWCTSDALSPSLRALQPAAGSRYTALVLTNTSDSACRTQGWPGLQLTGEAGAPMPTEVVRDRSRTPETLTVEAGGKAWSRLHWSVVAGEGDPTDGACPVPVAVRVIAPDRHTPADADWGELGSVCSSGRIDVQPLQPGSGPAQ